MVKVDSPACGSPPRGPPAKSICTERTSPPGSPPVPKKFFSSARNPAGRMAPQFAAVCPSAFPGFPTAPKIPTLPLTAWCAQNPGNSKASPTPITTSPSLSPPPPMPPREKPGPAIFICSSASPLASSFRSESWQLEGITHADHDVTIALSTSADASTRKTWPGDFHLLFCVTFGEQLRLELIVTNHGAYSFRFEEA